MKKRFISAGAVLALTAALLAGLWSGALAAETVYYTAVNDKMLDFSLSAMPVTVGGVVYVPYTTFDANTTKVSLGVFCVYNKAKSTVLVYNRQQTLVFDLSAGNSYDPQGNTYSARAITRNATVYLPAETVCSFFGLDYSYLPNEYGVLILVGGCVSWACGTLYSKYRCSVEEDGDGLAGAAWQMAAAGIVFAVCACVTGGFDDVNVSSVSTLSWLSLAYLITFGSLMAYTAYVWLLKVRPATEVATHAYVNPVVAVALGAGIGGEHVTAVQLAGLAVILLSVMSVNGKKK